MPRLLRPGAAGMAAMVTITDVARVVGCSPSTVARALNDSALISDATKQKVRQAARELGYVVHSAARLMRGESSTVIGLTVPDIENLFYATLARAVGEVCREAGFQLVLSITEDDPAIEYDQLRALVGAQVGGAVIVPTAAPLPESMSLLARLPAVQLIRHLPGVDLDCFSIDEKFGIHEATKHLIGLGHSRIAYVGADAALSTGAERFDGFQQAMRDAHLTPSPELLAFGAPRAAFARPAFRSIYEAGRPTAVISGGSEVTVGILQAIQDLSLSIPDDLSFVGYNDSVLYQCWLPPLTTVALPVREIALAGSAFLIRRIRAAAKHRDEEEGTPQRAHYLPRLHVRNSTAPLGGG